MNLLTLTQAVDATGLHESTIRKRLASGKLEGVKRENGAWLVSETDLLKHYPSNGIPVEAIDTTVMELREAVADLRKDRDAWREIAMRA